MEYSFLGVCVNDLDKNLSDIRCQHHKQDHYNNRIKLYNLIFTAYQGFFANGPGARVDRVPVENYWP